MLENIGVDVMGVVFVLVVFFFMFFAVISFLKGVYYLAGFCLLLLLCLVWIGVYEF